MDKQPNQDLLTWFDLLLHGVAMAALVTCAIAGPALALTALAAFTAAAATFTWRNLFSHRARAYAQPKKARCPANG